MGGKEVLVDTVMRLTGTVDIVVSSVMVANP